jgi:hypothetical protein
MLQSTVYWMPVEMDDEGEVAFFGRAIEDFAMELGPLLGNPTIQVEKLVGDRQGEVQRLVAREQSLSELNMDVLHSLISWKAGSRAGGLVKDRLVIVTTHNSRLAQRALQANPLALWGVAFEGGVLGIVYCKSRGVCWHEVLHLFNATDCYEVANPYVVTCEMPNCLMQYAPPESPASEALQLCAENVAAVRKYLGRP